MSSTYVITLADPSFYLLLAGLALFVGMYLALRAHTSSRRAFAGFREAVNVAVIFLVLAILAVVYLALSYPHGSRVAWAVSEVFLQGVWLAFAVPVVTVGFTVHSRTRGQVAWAIPSLIFAAGLFVVLYYWAFVNAT